MGCGMSTEEKEGKARNEEIENQLKRDKMMQRNEIKMLLLGAFTQIPPFLIALSSPRHCAFVTLRSEIPRFRFFSAQR
jgi:hypothetical protein